VPPQTIDNGSGVEPAGNGESQADGGGGAFQREVYDFQPKAKALDVADKTGQARRDIRQRRADHNIPHVASPPLTEDQFTLRLTKIFAYLLVFWRLCSIGSAFMAIPRNEHPSYRKPVKAPAFDRVDRKILSALRSDGRLTINELAQVVGLSPSPCWTRLKRLEAAGVIARYAAVLDHRAMGLANVVFVEVTLNKHDDKIVEEFGAALARIPEVVEAYLVTGDYDYLVKVVVSDTEHYERFLRESLYKIPGIQHSRSTFGLRAMKEENSIDPLMLFGE
jgi:Lrp/AsnC family transcriptional regulator, leucine-responsive regulatory protein